ncbi:MAG TPA: hypothetical protein VFS36_02230 [Chitinophagaceae bacterium]|jgi:dihydrofolate reductase|nr:hypothetical protein [Chitinophagaceae bacterium]
MEKLLLSAHLSLAGFVAGPGGEIDWIKLDEELFDYVGRLTDHAGTALYGRKTFEILEAYWPAAGSNPMPLNMTRNMLPGTIQFKNMFCPTPFRDKPGTG